MVLRSPVYACGVGFVVDVLNWRMEACVYFCVVESDWWPEAS